jgi:putative ABC transport system permease protein
MNVSRADRIRDGLALVMALVILAAWLIWPVWLDTIKVQLNIVEQTLGIELPDSLPAQANADAQARLPQISREQISGILDRLGVTPEETNRLAAAIIALNLPTTTSMGFAVPVGALIAGFAAALMLWKPRFAPTLNSLVRIGGLIVGAYFVYAFAILNSFVRVVALPEYFAPGFWIALAATLGLVLREMFSPPSATDRELRGASSVSLGLNIGVAFDALRANKLRSALTMLGIVIGVMSVVSLLSVGRGAQSAITEQINNIGTNLVTVLPASGTTTLTVDDAEAIANSISGLTYVVPTFQATVQIKTDTGSVQGRVIAATPDYLPTNNLTVEFGRFYEALDYQGAARVAIIGTLVADELFGGLNPVGRTIRVNGQRLDVIGVMQERDGGFGFDPNLQIYVPLTTAYRSLFEARAVASTRQTVSNISVSVTEADQVTRVLDDLERLLRRRHNLRLDDENDFTLFDQQQLLDAASTITGVLTVLLGAIAGVSLLVGGIGIMNISLVSVTERTREIGLRKALGARRTHIQQQFLIETVVLSTIGGLIGVLAGVGLAELVNASGILAASVTWDSIALGLGFSVLVGVFFGVYPARRAARLQPIEALRYE